jgi:hypothetical protein
MAGIVRGDEAVAIGSGGVMILVGIDTTVEQHVYEEGGSSGGFRGCFPSGIWVGVDRSGMLQVVATAVGNGTAARLLDRPV